MSHEISFAPPTEKELNPKQFGEYAAERRELKNIFDPLAETVAKRIGEAIALHSGEIRERLAEAEVDELSYTVLPPGLLEGKEYELSAPADLDSRERRKWLSILIDEYAKRIETDGTPYEKERYKNLEERLDHEVGAEWPPEEFPLGYDVEKEAKDHFDLAVWRKQEEVYRKYRERGAEEHLYKLLDMRIENGRNHYGASANYRSFMYTHADLKEDSRIVQNILVPVGEYGEEFAEDISRSTLFMIEALDTAIENEAAEATKTHPEVLREHTARGAEEKGGVSAHSTTLTIQEGVLSIMQTATLLTANKVMGYDDPARLLHDIIDQGIIEKVTRMMPAALVGPLDLQGKFFPHPIEKLEDGSLALTEEFTAQLHRAHGEYWKSIIDEKEYKGDHPKVGTGLTCPASGKGGGVGTLARVFDDVYQTVTDR